MPQGQPRRQGPRSGPQTKRDQGSARSDEPHETDATCALHDGAPTRARRLRPRRRLRRPTARTNRQREGEACVSENVTYVGDALNEDGPQGQPKRRRP